MSESCFNREQNDDPAHKVQGRIAEDPDGSRPLSLMLMPDELLSHVLVYSSFVDLGRLESTCKALKAKTWQVLRQRATELYPVAKFVSYPAPNLWEIADGDSIDPRIDPCGLLISQEIDREFAMLLKSDEIICKTFILMNSGIISKSMMDEDPQLLSTVRSVKVFLKNRVKFVIRQKKRARHLRDLIEPQSRKEMVLEAVDNELSTAAMLVSNWEVVEMAELRLDIVESLTEAIFSEDKEDLHFEDEEELSEDEQELSEEEEELLEEEGNGPNLMGGPMLQQGQSYEEVEAAFYENMSVGNLHQDRSSNLMGGTTLQQGQGYEELEAAFYGNMRAPRQNREAALRSENGENVLQDGTPKSTGWPGSGSGEH